MAALKNPVVDFKFPLLQFEFGDFALQLLDIGMIAACASGDYDFMAQAPEHKAVEVGHTLHPSDTHTPVMNTHAIKAPMNI
jgi:hypothetical protein